MSINSEPDDQQDEYLRLLRAIGSLSGLFSTSNKPYLNYRCHENIFCKAFGASNESRSDVAIDAVLPNHQSAGSYTGVGLKTFICEESTLSKTNQKFEKIAEFNKLSAQYRDLNNEDLVKYIARARNDRLEFAERGYKLQDNIYHYITRLPGRFLIHETGMTKIDTNSIELLKNQTDNVVNFKAEGVDYKFNRTKSTLFRAFTLDNAIQELSIEVVKDPYEVLARLSVELVPLEERQEVVLPFYSITKSRKVVYTKSGLNQWNAAGRPRSLEEVYIPIPGSVRTRFVNFFPSRDQPFDLYLPNGEKLNVKVCQDNGKALMSNPNVDLGKWLLRQVLNLAEGELLTYAKLLAIGIDSVGISYYQESDRYSIDFRPIGYYERFLNKHRM